VSPRHARVGDDDRAAFGAAGLAALCADIEAAATGGSGTDLPRLVGDVALEFDRVRASLIAELR